jgi:hypothetical protein
MRGHAKKFEINQKGRTKSTRENQIIKRVKKSKTRGMPMEVALERADDVAGSARDTSQQRNA